MKRTTLLGAVLLAAGCAGCNGSNDMVFQYNDATGRSRVNFAWQNKYTSGIPEDSYRREVRVDLEQDSRNIGNTVADAFERRARGVFGSRDTDAPAPVPGAQRLTVGEVIKDLQAGNYRRGRLSDVIERVRRANGYHD